jgi:glucose dehydrogenase
LVEQLTLNQLVVGSIPTSPTINLLKKNRKVWTALALVAMVTPAFAQGADWALYGGEGGRRFSSLSQITRANAGRLEQAWRFDMAEAGDPQTHPLAIGGVVYA